MFLNTMAKISSVREGFDIIIHGVCEAVAPEGGPDSSINS